MIKLKVKEDDRIIEFEKFPNGELNLGNKDIECINKNDNFNVVWKYENSESIIELYFLLSYMEQNNKDCQLIITYLPYSRMDRVDKGTNNIFSLKYIAELINLFNIEVYVVEAHSDISIELLKNSKNINLSNKIFEYVKNEKGLNKDNTLIMYPDEGAYKRYNYKLGFDTVYGEKVRDFKTGDIKGLELKGELSVKENAVIIDDLTSKGTTFYKSAEKLFNEGFKNVYLVVTHSENTITKGELLKCGITKVFTTNSLLDTEDKIIKKSIENNKIKVLDVMNLLKKGMTVNTNKTIAEGER